MTESIDAAITLAYFVLSRLGVNPVKGFAYLRDGCPTNAGIPLGRAGSNLFLLAQTSLIVRTRLPFAYIVHGLVCLIFAPSLCHCVRHGGTSTHSLSLSLFFSLLSFPAFARFNQGTKVRIYRSLNNYEVIRVSQANDLNVAFLHDDGLEKRHPRYSFLSSNYARRINFRMTPLCSNYIED